MVWSKPAPERDGLGVQVHVVAVLSPAFRARSRIRCLQTEIVERGAGESSRPTEWTLMSLAQSTLGGCWLRWRLPFRSPPR